MPYYIGKDVKAFISTENVTRGISQSGNSLSAVAWATDSLIANFLVPPLRTSSWSGTEADATGTQPARGKEITSLESLEPRPSHENEDIDFLGRVVQDHIRVRKMGEVVITRKMGENDYALTYDQANAGVTGSSINAATDQTVTDSGFRVYLRVSSGTGSGHTWYTFRNCQMTRHEIRPTAARTTVEALTFASNIWDIQNTPKVEVTAATEL